MILSVAINWDNNVTRKNIDEFYQHSYKGAKRLEGHTVLIDSVGFEYINPNFCNLDRILYSVEFPSVLK